MFFIGIHSQAITWNGTDAHEAAQTRRTKSKFHWICLMHMLVIAISLTIINQNSFKYASITYLKLFNTFNCKLYIKSFIITISFSDRSSKFSYVHGFKEINIYCNWISIALKIVLYNSIFIVDIGESLDKHHTNETGWAGPPLCDKVTSVTQLDDSNSVSQKNLDSIRARLYDGPLSVMGGSDRN
jgi:hypothetical protein